MSHLKKLIHEAHRRSLWQVLGIYLAVSWIALQIVDVLVSNFGLPDWVPPGALVLLVIGLPIVLATAFVQEGMGGRDQGVGGAAAAGSQSSETGAPMASRADPIPEGSEDAHAAEPAAARDAHGASPTHEPQRAPRSRMARLFTWRNAIVGGVLAFAALGFLVVSYWVMWTTGVGPVGSLVAQGVIEVQDPIILADFANGTDDPILGQLVTNTLRIDLLESPVITLAEPARIQQVLRRMQRDPEAPLTSNLALEVAVRDGMKAVIEGEVQPVGDSYVLAAIIRAADDGRSLSAFRVTADGADHVVDAIDDLSQRIRERAGESLKTIRAGEPLEQATTSSLDALRKLTEAERLTSQGDDVGAIALLKDAVALDTTFAMAYRKLAVLLSNNGIDFDRMVDAATRAYRHRDRLTDRERYLAEAYYHDVVTGDWDAQQAAYRAALRLNPNEPAALNNLALMYRSTDRAAAVELLERLVAMPGAPDVAFQTLAASYLDLNRPEDALAVADRFDELYPDNIRVERVRAWSYAYAGDLVSAQTQMERMRDDPDVSRIMRVNAQRGLAIMALHQGHVDAAREHALQAVRDAEDLGPSEELQRLIERARLELDLSLDRRRAIRILDEGLGRGLLDSAPVLDRPYYELAMALALTGEAERTEALLARWSAEAPPEINPGLIEGQQSVVRALLAEGAGRYDEALTLLEEGRRALHCVYCLTTLRARMIEEARGTEAGIAAWEDRAATPDMDLRAQVRDLPLVYEGLCSLHAQHGDRAKAVTYCGLFVEMWADADPELQPRVEAARRALQGASRVTGD